jgi:hypothetical protein
VPVKVAVKPPIALPKKPVEEVKSAEVKEKSPIVYLPALVKPPKSLLRLAVEPQSPEAVIGKRRRGGRPRKVL